MQIAQQENVEIQIRRLVHVPPQRFAPRLVDAVAQAAQSLGYSHRRMVSGAGHDAQIMARKYPSAMIFIPSQGGISHSPEESSRPEDLEAGANVLLRTVLHLAGT